MLDLALCNPLWEVKKSNKLHKMTLCSFFICLLYNYSFKYVTVTFLCNAEVKSPGLSPVSTSNLKLFSVITGSMDVQYQARREANASRVNKGFKEMTSLAPRPISRL